MNELDNYLPTSPNIGPPLPRILRAQWPWLKQPSPPPVLAVKETPSPTPTSAPAPEQAPPAPARLRRASDYQVETPPELIHELSPIRIDPSWLQSQ